MRGDFPAGPQVTRLADGRLHLHHGPIDMIVQAFGPPQAVKEGEARAVARFEGLLPELVAELPALRMRASGTAVQGAVAQVMAAAVAPFAPEFITPMAAVAGAGAEAVLAALAAPGVTRAYVNNGGDIAVHLAPGESLTCAIAARPGFPDRVTLRHADTARGIATSGWRGRSQSLGIADAVTVLARSAARADAAATMVANAVNLPDHPGILRRPAREVKADSDLGDRLVTVAVPPLAAAEVEAALGRGLAAAEGYRQRGLIEAAALFLQGEVRTTGWPALASAEGASA